MHLSMKLLRAEQKCTSLSNNSRKTSYIFILGDECHMAYHSRWYPRILLSNGDRAQEETYPAAAIPSTDAGHPNPNTNGRCSCAITATGASALSEMVENPRTGARLAMYDLRALPSTRAHQSKIRHADALRKSGRDPAQDR